MLIGFRRGQGSIVLRVKILNSSVATGAGLTGLTSASSGLIISTIADNEASPTTYTVAGTTIETITTLGTYAAPTATKCRFKEVDATNHKGVYEIQIADARFAVSSAKSLLVSISGATNAAETDVVIPLRDLDPYDVVRAGLTALPNVPAGANAGLPLSVDTSGRVDVLKVNGTSQTAKDLGASATQTGDSFARLGAAGAGLTALGDTRIANLDATVSSRGTSTLTSANVSTAIVNALTVDTYAQPAAVPAATASIKNMIGWLYTLGRNRVTQSATEQKLYADDGTTLIATSADSDDGTTTTRAKFT